MAGPASPPPLLLLAHFGRFPLIHPGRMLAKLAAAMPQAAPGSSIRDPRQKAIRLADGLLPEGFMAPPRALAGARGVSSFPAPYQLADLAALQGLATEMATMKKIRTSWMSPPAMLPARLER